MSGWTDKTVEFPHTIGRGSRPRMPFPFFRPFENIGPRVKIGRRATSTHVERLPRLVSAPTLIRRAVRGDGALRQGLGSSAPSGFDGPARAARRAPASSCAIRRARCSHRLSKRRRNARDLSRRGLHGRARNLSHASISMVRRWPRDASGSRAALLQHNSVRGLRRVLSSCAERKTLVVVEGLYGADGDSRHR